MNLHDIVQRMDHIEVIRDYVRTYYNMEQCRIRPDGRSLEYQFDSASRWDVMDERSTMSYTNAALTWAEERRLYPE